MNDFDLVVNEMMKEFGGSVVLQNITTTQNPVLGTTTDVVVSYPVKSLILEYQASDGISITPDSLIQVGDKQLYIQPKSSCGKTIPEIMPNKDRVLVNGKAWKIISVRDLNPSGTHSYLIELQIRK